MTETVFKAPKAKKSPSNTDEDEVPATVSKRPRTAEDFYLFCKFILEYENYEQEEYNENSGSPLGSTGSVTDSIKSESPAGNGPEDKKGSETDPGPSETEATSQGEAEGYMEMKEDVRTAVKYLQEEDSYDLVTCYCTKPFAGRPMIECSKCLTWIHLSCAKIKKTNIPEVFICVKCKSKKLHSVSSSVKHKKRLSV